MVRETKESRRSDRFDADAKVYYKFEYDVKTKIKYQNLQDNPHDKRLAYSKNVSVAGLCFSSDQEIECGDKLFIEVFLPGSNDPIPMEGIVKWSRHTEADPQGYFSTGIHIQTVRGTPIQETIYYDETYRIEWSKVLEEILGSYRIIAQKKKNNS